jgi:hypothetical protein
MVSISLLNDVRRSLLAAQNTCAGFVAWNHPDWPCLFASPGSSGPVVTNGGLFALDDRLQFSSCYERGLPAGTDVASRSATIAGVTDPDVLSMFSGASDSSALEEVYFFPVKSHTAALIAWAFTVLATISLQLAAWPLCPIVEADGPDPVMHVFMTLHGNCSAIAARECRCLRSQVPIATKTGVRTQADMDR